MTGYDRLGSGAGEMRSRLLRLIPVLTAAGPDVTRGGAPFGRYPFGVRVQAESRFGGITRLVVGHRPTARGRVLFRAEITGAVFS